MFDKEYSFRGSHALKVDKLTAQFDENSKAKLFARNIDVYVNAPIIGFLYGRKTPLDTSTQETAKIMGDRVIYSKEDLKYNYRLIILLDSKHEPDPAERINKAFRTIGTEVAAEDEALFESYVRGGVDVLYEKLIDGVANPDDYINRLYDFIEEFDERFNQAISTESILALCENTNV